jgi:aryl-alcohol dehydrogenase-like predicted oxidoreductase
MIDRRRFLGMAAGAGATLTLTPELLRALQQSQGQLIQRAIPSTGEMLPVIGVARGPVQNNARLAHLVDMVDPSSEAYAMLKAVVRTMVDNGGRVLDSQPAEGQQVTSMIAEDLGIRNRVFWSTGLPLPLRIEGTPPPDAAVVRAHLEAVFARLKVPRIDLMIIPASNPSFVISTLPTVLGVVREAKQDGRIRYIGVSELPTPNNPYATLESIMRNEPIDFIGVPHYHMANRSAEATLLPLAQERKIGVMVYMPFHLGRLFQRAGTTPLPEWAADFDIRTWAQFFLKYIVSHPAVTAVLPGTSSATHMLDNLGGGIGRLPNEATRKRMAELVDSFPPWQAPAAQAPGRVTAPAPPGPPVVLSAAILDRYVGEYKAASGPATFTFRRDGAALFVNPGPSAPLVARSETRFSFAGPEPVFEFQLDAQGRVTGVILEQRSQKTLLVRN